MCFSATANFVGSTALGAVGVVTLTHVKHRRELLFAALPTLFAVHQFTEGFVWLGLDGILSAKVAHKMGAAFMLYAQGLLPFLLPLSVLLSEPDRKPQAHAAVRRPRRSHPPLYFVGPHGLPLSGLRSGKQHRVHQSSHQQYLGRIALCDCHVRLAVFFEDQGDGTLRLRQPGDSAGRHGVQALRVHFAVVCLRRRRQCHHPRYF